MSSHLRIVSIDGNNISLRQKEFADAWQFSTSGDCLNFGQTDANTTDSDGNGGEVDCWAHACDLDLLIEMLIEARAKIRAHREGVGS